MRGLWAAVTRALGTAACAQHTHLRSLHAAPALPAMARPKRGKTAPASAAGGSRQLRVRGSAVVEAVVGELLLVKEEVAVAVGDGASPAAVPGAAAGAERASVPECGAGPAAGRGKRRGRAAHAPPPAQAAQVTAAAAPPGEPAAKPPRKRRKAAASPAAAAAPLAERVVAPAAELDGKAPDEAAPRGGHKPRPRKKVKATMEAGGAEGDAAAAAEAAPEAPKAKPRARRKKEPEQAAPGSTEFVPLPAGFPPGKLVGAHVSMASGMERAVVNAASIGEGFRLH